MIRAQIYSWQGEVVLGPSNLFLVAGTEKGNSANEYLNKMKNVHCLKLFGTNIFKYTLAYPYKYFKALSSLYPK